MLYIEMLETKITLLTAEKKRAELYGTVFEKRIDKQNQQISTYEKQVADLSTECNTLSSRNDSMRKLVREYKSLSDVLLARIHELESLLGVQSTIDSHLVSIDATNQIVPELQIIDDDQVEETTSSSKASSATHPSVTSSVATAPGNAGFGKALNGLFSKLFGSHPSQDSDSSTPTSPVPSANPEDHLNDGEQHVNETFEESLPVVSSEEASKVSSALVSFYSRLFSNPGAVDEFIAASERAVLLAELQDLESTFEEEAGEAVEGSDVEESDPDVEAEAETDNSDKSQRFLVDKQLAELVALFDVESLGLRLPKSVVSRAGQALSQASASSESYAEMLPSVNHLGTRSSDSESKSSSFSTSGTPKLGASNMFDVTVVRANHTIPGEIPDLALYTAHAPSVQRGRSRDITTSAVAPAVTSTTRTSSRSRSRSRVVHIKEMIHNSSDAPRTKSLVLQFPENDKDAAEVGLAYQKKAAELLGREQEAELERKISDKLAAIKNMIRDKQLERDQEHIVDYFEKVFQNHVDERVRDKARKIIDEQKKIVFGTSLNNNSSIDDSYMNALATSGTCATAPIRINVATSNSSDLEGTKMDKKPKRVYYAVRDQDVPRPEGMSVEVKCKAPIRETFFTDLKAQGFTSNPDLRTPDGKPWPRAPFMMKGEYLTADDIIDNLRAQRHLEEDQGLRSNMIDKLVLMGMDKRYEYLVRREFEKSEIKDNSSSMTSFDRASQFLTDKLFGYK